MLAERLGRHEILSGRGDSCGSISPVVGGAWIGFGCDEASPGRAMAMGMGAEGGGMCDISPVNGASWPFSSLTSFSSSSFAAADDDGGGGGTAVSVFDGGWGSGGSVRRAVVEVGGISLGGSARVAGAGTMGSAGTAEEGKIMGACAWAGCDGAICEGGCEGGCEVCCNPSD